MTLESPECSDSYNCYVLARTLETMPAGLLEEQFATRGHQTSKPDSSLPLSFWATTMAFEEEELILPCGNLCLGSFE